MTNELLPCPFCGSKPRIEEFRQLSFPWQIICDCHEISDTQSHTCFIEADTKEEAITAWNTRHERTCRNLATRKDGFCCSECECEVVGCMVDDFGDFDNPLLFSYCPNCGAKVVE